MGKQCSWRPLWLEECRGGPRRRCSQVLATMAALHLHDHVFWQTTPNSANLSTPGITGQSTKYAPNWIYQISDAIKPADKIARKKTPNFSAVLPNGYICPEFGSSSTTQSGVRAVVPNGYICKGKLVDTQAHGAGSGRQFMSSYNHSNSRSCTCTHYVTFWD